MHAFASMAAIKRGKHVYCEKPLTHSVWEARQVAEAAREQKVATQMGNQGQASEETRRLCELVWAGAIGPVREAHIWTDRPSQRPVQRILAAGRGAPQGHPARARRRWIGICGSARRRSGPYHPAYLPFRWRGWWDFGTGALGDIGCHAMDPVFRALKLGAPLSVQAASTRVNEETYPLGSMVTYQFPARDAESQANNCHVQGLTGAAPAASRCRRANWSGTTAACARRARTACPRASTMGDNGRLLVGDKGFILGNRSIPESRAQGSRRRPARPSRAPPAITRNGSGLQRRQARRLELRLGRSAGRSRAAGQRGPARATARGTDPPQAAVGCRQLQVHQPGRGQPVPPPRIPRRVDPVRRNCREQEPRNTRNPETVPFFFRVFRVFRGCLFGGRYGPCTAAL